MSSSGGTDDTDKGGVKTAPKQVLASAPEQIDALQVIVRKDLREAPYHERRDHRITTAALGVIVLSAVTSCIGLLYPMLYPPDLCPGTEICPTPEPLEWPAEMLRLSLVASLAFVMGNNGKQA